MATTTQIFLLGLIVTFAFALELRKTRVFDPLFRMEDVTHKSVGGEFEYQVELSEAENLLQSQAHSPVVEKLSLKNGMTVCVYVCVFSIRISR